MTKNVLFYARYSTDRQNEVSIETQIELGRKFVADRGWKLVDIYSDAAVSGTSFALRPGIQQLLAHVRRERIDVVLCVTVDRLSRDVEHSSKILKELNYHDTAIWTVQAGQEISHIELHMRSTLSHELVEQIRYRTREGMKTAVRKGKATTCLAYGYKLKLAYDGNGDRIPGLREIDTEQAEMIRWIFKNYAEGVSPRDIAKMLNDQGIPGPRGAKWRDTAIRGHASRGTGILNNETYIGRVVWNRRNYRKNPETERRVARGNKDSDWVVNDVPDLRIIDDGLWARVKARQKELGDLFSYTTTNRLNAAHRPSYLLSGILECAECGGPYAVMAKDRYGCTNHKKRLPIDGLDGACCRNQKTILRNDIEERVLACLPAAFLHLGIFEKVAADVLQRQTAKLKSQPALGQHLKTELSKVEQEQKNIIQQISDRAAESRPRLAALDDMLDRLEEKRADLSEQLTAQGSAAPDDTADRLAELRAQINPDTVQHILDTVLFYLRDHADTATKQPFVDIIRQFVQKVVIGKTPGHQPASLEVHGRIASILAAMDAARIMEERFKLLKHHDYLARIGTGELETDAKRKKLLDAYAEELSVKRLEWENIQVSVVAGAGFEPAAFRL
ncbi:resolvase [Brucella endophytica]|uniref:Resolvase n=1 Tax=Brucella endophytica TaxID=1963359 RepID=A0A916WLR2_9HYPH|nr:recombinase family protein [Brucella endophytica]GGB13925.1 resolvase [Brucella endophytica]